MTGFRGSKIVSDSLVLVFMTPVKVRLNKPLHIGATILEHSKRVMYDKFYNFIIPSFDNVGKNFFILLIWRFFSKLFTFFLELSTTDTDSFLFSCEIPDGDTVTSVLKKHQGHFDFSNLSENGRLGKELFSTKHKNQLNR